MKKTEDIEMSVWEARKEESLPLWKGGEYTRKTGKFKPNITAYIHTEDETVRPGILVVPGGGYCVVSCTEGEIVAKEFFLKGYNTFVVTYTTEPLIQEPLKLQPLKDLSRAMVMVRKNSDYFHVNPHMLAICGFSAGGHLCGSLAVHYDEKELEETGEYREISNRPDAVILGYPVITTGEFCHKDSFQVLLGANASSEELEYMSLEKNVSEKTPPSFLWQTATDELVPVENSILFAESCRKKKVPVALHIFESGKHGMSVANEEWAYDDFTGLYTMEQFFEIFQGLVDSGKILPAPFDQAGMLLPGTDVKKIYGDYVKIVRDDHPDEEIAQWPEMADRWLKKRFGK